MYFGEKGADMYTIRDDIKSGKLKDVYLLYGVEHYLVTQYRDNLLQAFCGSRKKAELEDALLALGLRGGFTLHEVEGISAQEAMQMPRGDKSFVVRETYISLPADREGVK